MYYYYYYSKALQKWTTSGIQFKPTKQAGPM